MQKTVQNAAFFLLFALLAACHRTGVTTVNFKSPPGAILQMGGKNYQIPGIIALPWTGDKARNLHRNGSGGKEIKLILADGTKIKGFLCVYDIRLNQIEKFAEIWFRLSDEQIARLKGGYAVTVIGYTAADNPVYRFNLGLEK